ncbi:hypothetical protein NQZ68_003740 [Dissostichus eleginoides]|nr:hypothetical protein NQZ68_003740 [Dissostichus eleginoides]
MYAKGKSSNVPSDNQARENSLMFVNSTDRSKDGNLPPGLEDTLCKHMRELMFHRASMPWPQQKKGQGDKKTPDEKARSGGSASGRDGGQQQIQGKKKEEEEEEREQD